MWYAASICLIGHDKLMKFLRAATVIALSFNESIFKESFINTGRYQRDDPENMSEVNEIYKTALENSMVNGRWGNADELFALSMAIGMPIYSYNPCINERDGTINLSDESDFGRLQKMHLESGDLNKPGPFVIFAMEEYRNRHPIAIYNNRERTHYTALLPRSASSRFFQPNAYYNMENFESNRVASN